MVFAVILTLVVGWHAFFMAISRIDTSEELRWILFLDIMIGLFTGLLAYLWFHGRIKGRLGKRAFVFYLIIGILISICFAAWHLTQVICRRYAF